MRIEPSGVQPQPTRPTTSSPVRAADKAGDGAAPAAATAAGGFAPTGELARLLTSVSQQPEVRAEVVASVAARLAAGEFDTAAAAADAARAMLDPTR